MFIYYCFMYYDEGYRVVEAYNQLSFIHGRVSTSRWMIPNKLGDWSC
jgi:hypothetical protein